MPQQPNLLFIMTDQQRADAMGCSGGWVRTPSLDRIAQEGVRFTNAVTNSPVCIPARVSLATGLYPHNTGVWNNLRYDLPAHTPTWMQAVREAGYRTSLFGKTHLHHHEGDLREREHLLHGWGIDDVDEIGGPRASALVLSHMTERWEKKGLWEKYKADYAERFANNKYVARPSVLPLEEYADVYVGRQARRWLESYEEDKPWFCWVSFGGPHGPWDAPEPYASMYRPEDMPPPAMPDDSLSPDRIGGKMDRMLLGAPGRTDKLPPEQIAAMRANYAGNVTLIDDQIGEILQMIEARGELDNTAIVFSSDHGEMNGDHGLTYKNQFFNGAVRVPLVVRTPETAALLSSAVAGRDACSTNTSAGGRVCKSPTEWFDIGPTMAELAGGELKHQQFARSLRPLLEEPDAEHRHFAVSEISRELMIMDGRWKLIFNSDGEPYLLFDQTGGRGETENRIHSREAAGTVERMQEQLFRHLVRTQVELSSR